jgi:hypothetical protein
MNDALSGPTDQVANWTVRAMPKGLVNEVVIAAKRENVTVSQWLERVIRLELQGERVSNLSAEPVVNTFAKPPLALPAPADHARAVELAMTLAGMQETPETARARLLRAARIRVGKMLRTG